MIIQSSQVQMSAEHEKSEIVQINRTFDVGSGSAGFLSFLQEAAGLLPNAGRPVSSDQVQQPSSDAEGAASVLVMTDEGYQFKTEETEQVTAIQQEVTHARLLHSLMEAISGRTLPAMSLEEGSMNNVSGAADTEVSPAPEQMQLRPIMMEMSFSLTESIEEYECSSFSSCGQVKTADGREIEFGLELMMERSYSATRTVQVTREVVFTDPLILNFDGSSAELSDEKYAFDLNADGESELISYLGENSGMLALDKNGDGVVNDGTELFGALSGNGFADLAEYDEDGNNYIDEADSIFSELLIWTKTQNEDTLASLKDNDVGAIYLGSVETPFDLKGQDNQQNGQVRASGFYLTEAGAAGTLQQIDMAV